MTTTTPPRQRPKSNRTSQAKRTRAKAAGQSGRSGKSTNSGDRKNERRSPAANKLTVSNSAASNLTASNLAASRAGRSTRTASKARAERIVRTNNRSVRTVDIRKRLLVVLAFFLATGVGYIGVLVDLQAIRPEEYVAIGEQQRSRTVNLAGYRGTISDRDGFVLALSTPGIEVVADPQMIDDHAATAALLAPILDMSTDELTEVLLPSSDTDRYAMVSAKVSDQMASEIAVLTENSDNDSLLNGIFVRAQEQRVYPADDLALPIIGRVDPQEIGFSGLEFQYNEAMAGTAGYEQSESGVFGSITGGDYVFEAAVPGNDIVLTLDHRLQYVTEQELIAHCEETSASGANSVVSDTRTGEILAMATVTRIDGKCVVPKQNVPLQAVIEPGSVLKMVTAAAAVEDHGLTANTVLDVPSSIDVGDKTFENHYPAAPYPVRQVIADSMNAGTIQLAQQVGDDRLRYYLDAFGFGRQTGLDFRYENRGRVPEAFFGSDLGSVAIGQGISVNTVQLAAAYNVIANGGQYVAPSLIRSMVDSDGAEVQTPALETRRVISPQSAAEVTTMLVDVVTDGTGTAAAIPGYTVAGKTGTAWQVFEQPDGTFGYGPDGGHKYVVTFAGFLPAENPQLSIIVVVNDPQTATTASKIAAPVFADIAQYAIRILAIPPSDAARLEAGVEGTLRGTPAPQAGNDVVNLDNQDGYEAQGPIDGERFEGLGDSATESTVLGGAGNSETSGDQVGNEAP